MKTPIQAHSKYFSSKYSVLILSGILITSILFTGVSFAVGLNIPTNLTNAVITIQKIFLSTNGVNTNPNTVGILLDGESGNIKTNNIGGAGGALSVAGVTTLSHSDYKCLSPGTTNVECLLRTDTNGRIYMVAPSGISGLGAGTGNNTNSWTLSGNTLTGENTLGTISNHDLPIITNNIEKMRITAAGNVGIGTSTPVEKIEVKGGHTNTRIRLFSDNFAQGIGGANTALLSLWASEPGITWNGVGIGNNIKGNTFYGRENTNIGASYMRLLNNSVVINTIDSAGGDVGGITIENGNVGINTASPSTKLHVNGNVRITNGSEGLGKSLISDANGNSSWKLASPVKSTRDFILGTLISTDIDYSQTSGDPFLIEIEGNSYGDSLGQSIPFLVKYQGYIRANTIINHGGLSVGSFINGMVAMNVNGKLCFWFPRQTYWQGFTVNVDQTLNGIKENRVTSIIDISKPSGTKEVALNNYKKSVGAMGAGGTTNYVSKFTTDSTIGNSQIYDNGTNVGIGTSSPTEKLDVNGTIRVGRGGILGSYGNTTNHTSTQNIWSIGSSWNLTNSASTSFGNIYGMSYSYDGYGGLLGWGHQIGFHDNGTRNAAISLSNGNAFFQGNVGVGTSAPSAKLDVNGQIKITGGNPGPNKILVSDATGLGSWFDSSTLFGGFGWKLGGNALTTAQNIGTTSNHDLPIITNNTEKMRITANGNVGIGTASPSTKLHVNGNIQSDGSVTANEMYNNGWYRSNGNGGWYNQTYGGGWHMTDSSWIRGYNGKSLWMGGGLIGGDGGLTIGYGGTSTPNGGAIIAGNVGIGTTAPSQKLHVNGYIRANGYYYNSDRRYKSDIEDLESPLNNLLKLSGYSYFNTLSQKKDIGVIAQEVEKIYPEIVHTDTDGYKSVQYGNLVAPIIEAIKVLATKIDNLFNLYLSQQAKIDSLEQRLQQAKISSLEQRLQELESKIK